MKPLIVGVIGRDPALERERRALLHLMHHQQVAPIVVPMTSGNEIRIPRKLNHKGEPFTNADQFYIDRAADKAARKAQTRMK